MTKNQLRDVTRILRLAKKGAVEATDEHSGATFMQIASIAKAIDARSGRRDPSVRKAAKRKRATK